MDEFERSVGGDALGVHLDTADAGAVVHSELDVAVALCYRQKPRVPWFRISIRHRIKSAMFRLRRADDQVTWASHRAL